LSLPKSVYKKLPKRLPKSLGFSRYSLDFNGSNYVEVPDDPSLEGMGELSICLWVRPESFDSYDIMIGKTGSLGGYASSPYQTLVNYGGAKKPRLYLGDGASYWLLEATETLSTGVWAFVAYVYDGTYMKIYKNGRDVGTNNIGAVTLATNAETVKVAYWDGSYPYEGMIDGVLIYDRGLSQEEVNDLMLDYHNPSVDGLVGWWRFEEGIGTTAEDKSSEGNDGTLKPVGNPPIWEDIRKWELRSEAGL